MRTEPQTLVATSQLHAELVEVAVEVGGRVRVVEDILVTRCAAFELRDCTIVVDVSSPGVALAILVEGTCSATAVRPGVFRVRYRAPPRAD